MNELLDIDGEVGNDRPCGEMTSGHWSKRAWLFMEVVTHTISPEKRITMPFAQLCSGITPNIKA